MFCCRQLIVQCLQNYSTQPTKRPHLQLAWNISKRTMAKLKPSTRILMDLEPIMEDECLQCTSSSDDTGPFDRYAFHEMLKLLLSLFFFICLKMLIVSVTNKLLLLFYCSDGEEMTHMKCISLSSAASHHIVQMQNSLAEDGYNDELEIDNECCEDDCCFDSQLGDPANGDEM